jgi:hypothetical protein
MTIITRTGRMVKNERGGEEPEEKSVFFKGTTVAGCAIRVLSPHHLPIIYLTDKKTDKENAQKLARLIADRPDSRLPIVPIPSDEEMERRKILSSYRREQGTRNQAINRLQRTFSPTLFCPCGNHDGGEVEPTVRSTWRLKRTGKRR